MFIRAVKVYVIQMDQKVPIPTKEETEKFCKKNDFTSITFLKTSQLGTVLYYILYFIPIPFLIYLIDRWIDKKIMLYMLYDRAIFLDDADTIAIVDQSGGLNLEDISKEILFMGWDEPSIRCFTFAFLNVRYVYKRDKKKFTSIMKHFAKMSVKEAIDKYEFGRYEKEIPELQKTYGKNLLEIAKPRVIEILLSEILSIMGVFEIVAVTLVYLDGTYRYMTFVLALIIFSKYSAVMDAFSQYNEIQKYLLKSENITVIRRNMDNCFSKILVSNQEIVPGDIVEIASNQKISADSIIISGSCVMDERDISGDSMPKIKYAIDENLLVPLIKSPENSLSLAGSFCSFTRTALNESVLAIVIATGYSTMKGRLLRSLLMPKVVKFRFFDEALTFVYIIAIFSILGAIVYLIIQTYFMTDITISLKVGIIKVGQMFFATVKPVLPFCLYMGLQASKERLEFIDIFTSNKFKINECGRVDTIFFDKTGTITQNFSIFSGMFMVFGTIGQAISGRVSKRKIDTRLSAVPSQRENISQHDRYGYSKDNTDVALQQNIFKNKIQKKRESMGVEEEIYLGKDRHFTNKLQNVKDLAKYGEDAKNFFYCLSFCNNLIKSGTQVIGDNIDLEMYGLSPYELHYEINRNTKQLKKFYTLPSNEFSQFDLPKHVDTIKSFDYFNEFKTEGVIINDGKDYYLVTKGAPEVIAEICDPLTVPVEFDNVLYDICSEGQRVLGFAIKKLTEDSLKMNRSDIECDMNFCGFFAFDNPIKPETTSVIKTLTKNFLRCIMITGDNIFTGISVAQRSGFIPPQKHLYLGDVMYTEAEPNGELYFINLGEGGQEENGSNVGEQKKASQEVLKLQEFLAIDISSTVIALTGASYDFLYDKYYGKSSIMGKTLFERIHQVCLVYGRCDPYQKARIVKNEKEFHLSKYPVAYVGDGANDTEAMSHADVSLMLARSEISFAAPFSISSNDLTKVIELIKEGKVSVENGYANFKFFVFLVGIQFVATFLLYLCYIGFNSYEGVFMDVGILMVLIGMLNTFPHKKQLNKYKPKSSMLAANLIIESSSHIFVGAVITIIGYHVFKQKSFYKPPHHIVTDADKIDYSIVFDDYKFYDNHFLFCLINFLFLSYFIFTNYNGLYRVKMIRQRKVLIVVGTLLTFLIYLANLSQKEEVNEFDNMLIKTFGILRTYKTNAIYVGVVVTYWLCAVIIEKMNDFIFFYRESKKFIEMEHEFIQHERFYQDNYKSVNPIADTIAED